MKSFLSPAIIVVTAAVLGAWPSAFANEPRPDTDDTETRLNPEMEKPEASSAGLHGQYPFINLSKNIIDMNGDSWNELAAMFARARKGGRVSVVHIGDSHIQADGNTGKVRKLLQEEYGDAGRGLMIPYRIAGTNQPLDYKITATGTGATASLLKMPWKTDMGFTGISVKAVSPATFTVESPTPFSVLKIYGKGDFSVTNLALGNTEIEADQSDEPWGVEIKLSEPVKTAGITMTGKDFNIFGFDARNPGNEGGVLYHAIGNNGATFGTYNQIGDMGNSIRNLDPDLVILSLGTNEAFGKMTDAAFKSSVDRLVNDIRSHNPNVKLLLTTPSECQRSVYSRTRKGRRRARRTRTYQVNANVKRMRNLLLEYGRENNIPTYDFYEVAGGDGASAKWLQAKLLGADRIHRTWQGYYTEGELLYEALSNALHLKSEAINAVELPLMKPMSAEMTDSVTRSPVKVTSPPKAVKKATATKAKKKTRRRRKR